MKFNYAWEEENSNVEPEYLAPYGTDYPPITAQGNLTYLQFIDLVGSLWARAHPEIQFLPFSAGNIYDRENGYVIYSLETRRTHNNNSKPKVHQVVDHPTEQNKKLVIYIQSFDNIIKFSCIHKDPRIAEELVEAFEDFMLEVTPIFVKLGIDQCIYNRRLPDQHEVRTGDDIASRTVSYLVITQKIVHVDVKKLEEVIATITIADPEYRALAMQTAISAATPSTAVNLLSSSISHSRLSNLEDDDHLQYLTQARHNVLDHSFLDLPAFQGPSYYGVFQDNLDQFAASTTSSNPIIMRVTDESNGVSIESNGTYPTRIKVNNRAVYNIQFSIQFINTDNHEHDISVWFRKNGIDIPSSNSQFTIPKSHAGGDGKLVAALNYMLTLNANDYMEIIWQSDNINVSIQTLPAEATPSIPLTPSVIVTVCLAARV